MKKKLRILMIEDSTTDAEIVLRQIRRSGVEPESLRVETKEEMQAALMGQEWDVIIADYSLPRFSGQEALET
jgi:CheY-like chemotaxis protein